ncbi:MAG TPA: alpha/beta hydrolase [Allosphingosinicella sp.]|jgi:pimeloyl-ACP methyl ester carboxylesterase
MDSAFRQIAAALSLLMLCIASPAVSARTADQAPPGEEVRFASDPGTMLAGTLETPRGFGAGPFPVAVIVSGTGPWVRGGWVHIRARLLASGIATFMYDKRGLGASTGEFEDTIPAMERDVAAAAAFLRTRRDIDPRRIALMGISQGAVAAPLVASRDPGIAAVVMLSGPVGPRGELFLGILRANLASGGKSPADIAHASAAVGAWMEARSRGAAASEVAPLRQAAVSAFAAMGLGAGALDVLDNPVVLSMYEVAPDRALRAVRAPVLAIYGSRDDIIAPELSYAAAVAALADNPDALIVAVPGMTHELTRAAPLPPGQAAPEDGTMPVVTDTVGAWLARRLGTAPPDR